MEGGDAEKRGHQMENLRLIDISSEDDFLVASLRDDDTENDAFEGLRLSVTFENSNRRDGFPPFNSRNQPGLQNVKGPVQKKELESLSLACSKPEGVGRNIMSSVRKSLTWDNTFFTSEGILNPEELSIVSKGFEKGKTSYLPCILEDLSSFTPSNSTLDSVSFPLGSFEIDLLEDIKASVQKESHAEIITSGSVTKQNTNASKKLDVASGNKMITPASRRQNVCVQRSGKIKNAVSATGAKHVKLEKKDPGATIGFKMSKRSSHRDSTNFMAGSTPAQLSSFAVTSPASSGSTAFLQGKSDGASSNILSFNSFRKRIDSVNPGVVTSASKPKTSNRSSRTKITQFRSPNTIYLSLSSLSSCSSPARSTDRCFSKSSDSTSAAGREHTASNSDTLTTSGGVSSAKVTNQAAYLQSPSCYQSLAELGLQESTVGAKDLLDTKNGSSHHKASGIRKPTPKIGVFDEDKYAEMLDKTLQFHSGVHSALPTVSTITCKSSRATKLTRPRKPQPSRSSSDNDQGKAGQVCPATPEQYGRFGFKKNCPGATKVAKVNSLPMSPTGLRPGRQLEDKSSQGLLTYKLSKTENPKRRQNHLVKNRNLKKVNDGENICTFDGKVDGLSKQVGALNFQGDVILELKGMKSCQSQTGTKKSENCSKSSPHFTTADEQTNCRPPLAAKDSLCNGSEENAA